MEFNAVIEEFSPLVTWFVVTETDRRPAVFLGTSSDRIGSPEGMTAFYATMSKQLPALGASAYVSLNHSQWDDGFNVPFGMIKEIGQDYAVRWMYDGRRSHALLDRSFDDVGVSLMWVWLERFGVALHTGF